MKQYKGYYIDHVSFNSKDEIDAFIKKLAIERHEMLARMFADKPSMELSVMMSDNADRLHNVFGMGYEFIEEIEINAISA